MPEVAIFPEAGIFPEAAIFDVDGTLVDSVDLHASAWQEALTRFGHKVTFEQVPRQIAKGGDQLIPAFLSRADQGDHGADLEEWRGERFRSKYLALVRPISAVPAMLRCVREVGLKITVASAAKAGELAVYPAPGALLAGFGASPLAAGRIPRKES